MRYDEPSGATLARQRGPLAFGFMCGPAAVALCYFVGMRLDLMRTNSGLVGAVVVPFVLLVPFLVWPRTRRPALLFGAGALLGVVLTVAFVVGLISLLAFLLSDPA
ncbi:hypothetical protein [Nocardioides speluncae]|uniref:hypothetical protein n=1 Tax=Nocardioides speluncae TaxID=2670337 RepID=UPI000D68C12F|nr:hypothetical protein [Nocardioides speluncae]